MADTEKLTEAVEAIIECIEEVFNLLERIRPHLQTDEEQEVWNAEAALRAAKKALGRT